jgi:membrane protease YdiL (CAAX protease family)
MTAMKRMMSREETRFSQFLASTAIGVVWGYVYVKRGYETVVLAHTLSDWLPFLWFAS